MSSADPPGAVDPLLTPAVGEEVALALLVGADEQTAVALARRIISEWPRSGVLVISAAAASRWGIDIVPAMVRLAGGEALRGTLSDYELRTAAEEAEDEADRSLDRMARTVEAGADSQTPETPYVLDRVEPLSDAVRAAIAGRRVWDVGDVPTSSTLGRRIIALSDRLGVGLITHGDISAPMPRTADGALQDGVYVGFDRLLQGHRQ